MLQNLHAPVKHLAIMKDSVTVVLKILCLSVSNQKDEQSLEKRSYTLPTRFISILEKNLLYHYGQLKYHNPKRHVSYREKEHPTRRLLPSIFCKNNSHTHLLHIEPPLIVHFHQVWERKYTIEEAKRQTLQAYYSEFHIFIVMGSGNCYAKRQLRIFPNPMATGGSIHN